MKWRYRFSVPILTSFVFFAFHNVFPQDGFIQAERANLYFSIIGSGEPVVILHGGPGLDHTYLLPQFIQLAKRYKLIFYDQRATGKSTGIVDSVSMSPKQFVEDLEILRKALNIEKVNLLGHSWGSLLAIHYASRYPQYVKSLILVSSPGPTSGYFQEFITQRTLRTTPQDSLELARILASNEFTLFHPSAIQDYARVTFRSYVYNREDADKISLTFNEQTAKNLIPAFLTSLKFYPFDLREPLSRTSIPTIILHGDADVIPPMFAEELHKTIQGSVYVTLKHCGHFPYIESSEEFFSFVDNFLSRIVR
ncbi:MAG: alpha/beta hydrolase [Bacteroidetes bacterium]|nr:alpha/beta hydrolase [Bacteroidota bacterium]